MSVFRKRYIQHPETLELIPAEEYERPKFTTHFVWNDIQPYRSQIDGSMISSRSTHKAHLKAHGCVEVGNEKLTPTKRPDTVKQDILRAWEARNGA